MRCPIASEPIHPRVVYIPRSVLIDDSLSSTQNSRGVELMTGSAASALARPAMDPPPLSNTDTVASRQSRKANSEPDLQLNLHTRVAHQTTCNYRHSSGSKIDYSNFT